MAGGLQNGKLSSDSEDVVNAHLLNAGHFGREKQKHFSLSQGALERFTQPQGLLWLLNPDKGRYKGKVISHPKLKHPQEHGGWGGVGGKHQLDRGQRERSG